jgi:hypothetical protein
MIVSDKGLGSQDKSDISYKSMVPVTRDVRINRNSTVDLPFEGGYQEGQGRLAKGHHGLSMSSLRGRSSSLTAGSSWIYLENVRETEDTVPFD